MCNRARRGIFLDEFTMSHKGVIGILQVLDSLGAGGAEQVVLMLAKHLDRDRFNVVVCTLFSRDPSVQEPLAKEIRGLGIRVEMLAMTRWRDWKAIRAFLNLMDEERIDIVHGHMVPADFWGCLLTRLCLYGRIRKTVCTKHSMLPPTGPADRLQQFALNVWLADRVVSISDAVTHYLVAHCHTPPWKIVGISNPVDTEVFSPRVSGRGVRREFGIPDEAVVIGNTSRFEALKGYGYFLRIASRILERYPEVRFLAIGHGSEENRLRQQIRDLGLEGRVILDGPRRDIPEVLGAMDIFLFTSLWGEGFGIVLIEAMAAGKAIVATNVGPTRELIEDGVSGFLPSPKTWMPEARKLDIEPMVEKAELLIEDADLRRRLGEAARQRAIERFTVERFVKRTERLYGSLLV